MYCNPTENDELVPLMSLTHVFRYLKIDTLY